MIQTCNHANRYINLKLLRQFHQFSNFFVPSYHLSLTEKRRHPPQPQFNVVLV